MKKILKYFLITIALTFFFILSAQMVMLGFASLILIIAVVLGVFYFFKTENKNG